MKILIFSLGPVFKDHVHGGSQKILREVAKFLGSQGHTVKILCVRRDDNKSPFILSKNVVVHPILQFKQYYPAAYFTSPHNLANIIYIINKEIQEHDLFYVHDAQLDFPFLYESLPTIISLRDFIYPETLIGAFNFDRDKIIVNSTYVKSCVNATLGNIKQGISQKISLINNGINLKFFKKTDTTELKKKIHVKDEDLIILYPHRPEESKGIFHCLELIQRIKEKGFTSVKLLIPQYIDLKVNDELNDHYQNVLQEAKKKSVEENIIFHEWIPYEMLPAYYSLGKAVLTIGNFIEAFGSNTILEALACETHPITVKVGAIRTTLPDHVLKKFDFGDLDAIEEQLIDVLSGKQTLDFKKIRAYLDENFNYRRMLEQYEQEITSTKKGQKTPLINNLKEDLFMLAPWCYISSKGIYNDYKYDYRKKDQFQDFLAKHKTFSLQDIEREGITKEFFKKELDEGTVVRKNVET